MTTGLLLAGAVAVLALPSAVLAFSNRFDPPPAPGSLGTQFASAASDASVAALAMRSLANGHPFRFTPAGTPNRPDRSVTVAVRVDPQTASAITVRGVRTVALQIPPVAADATQVRLSPTAFTLGVSRGYESFAQVVTPDVKKIEMPDLATFKSRNATPAAPSRFSPRIALDDKVPAGRAPRTFAGEGEDRVDLGGAYRVTRNIDVTAGVRYSRDRDRLQPLTDGKQDSQAVYVGTQFKF
jgi:hypothetical protein